MIWDFRGPNSEMTAKHHAKHLQDFTNSEKMINVVCQTEKISEMHYVAFMVVAKEKVNDLRERLKPNRGQAYKEI